ncbi:MAG: hypothetical protein JJT94_14895 [Bernardetiaceae bacterium]|nr:hypothetical protein [Bernardetiaceae bacterium]
MSDSSRERDLVLAPNEFAFISDQTKGHINTYVGPYKTSLANTDKPVYFDSHKKQFCICSLEESIQTFATAPEGWYIVLKNPAHDAKQPKEATSNSISQLDIGRKVNLPGPTFFALWPGQMVRIIPGHQLRSNQYLVVRIYDEEQARKNWENAVVKKQSNVASEGGKDTSLVGESDSPTFTTGQQLIIKGTHISFYIPPTGMEVVPDKNGNYVRDAVTLERLEYCILLDENGNKRFIEGPAVVFPEPTETFVVKDGFRKFKAIELNEISGIYVKVITAYQEGDKAYNIGDELFITGKEQRIYFPRPEHALIRYGKQEIYYAVAIPKGEGRYFLNRNTGQIALQKGPCMFLPDPREAVIVRRILTEKQAKLWYPGNEEVLAFNRQLRRAALEEGKDDLFIEDKEVVRTKKIASPSRSQNVAEGIGGDDFVRDNNFTKPRTVTLDTKYEGAVTVEVWTGYAVLVVNKTGERKVIVGPQTYNLEYDEILGVVDLSTGTPKSDVNVLQTVYLRSLHNQISDIVSIETADFCPIDVRLSYRVDFIKEPEKWFNVENYVKFLTDHLRSVLRNSSKKYNVADFYGDAIAIIRNIILGEQSAEDGKRKGRFFEENNMFVYDVEVIGVDIMNHDISTILSEAQHNEVRRKLALQAKRQEFSFIKESEDIDRKIAEERAKTKQEERDLQIEMLKKELELSLTRITSTIESRQKELEGEQKEADLQIQINSARLESRKAVSDIDIAIAEQQMQLRLEELKGEVQAVVSKAEAISPDLVAALQNFSDRALAAKMAESMAPLSILGGKSVADVFANMLKGTALESAIQTSALGNAPSKS